MYTLFFTVSLLTTMLLSTLAWLTLVIDKKIYDSYFNVNAVVQPTQEMTHHQAYVQPHIVDG